MARLKKMFPFLVACFMIAVGIFFLASALLKTGLLNIDPAGKIWIIGIAIVLTGSGVVFAHMARTGKLRKDGPTITEVRTEAVSGLDSKSLLADIAANDPKAEVRRTAKERLEELQAQ